MQNYQLGRVRDAIARLKKEKSDTLARCVSNVQVGITRECDALVSKGDLTLCGEHTLFASFTQRMSVALAKEEIRFIESLEPDLEGLDSYPGAIAKVEAFRDKELGAAKELAVSLRAKLLPGDEVFSVEEILAMQEHISSLGIPLARVEFAKEVLKLMPSPDSD